MSQPNGLAPVSMDDFQRHQAAGSSGYSNREGLPLTLFPVPAARRAFVKDEVTAVPERTAPYPLKYAPDAGAAGTAAASGTVDSSSSSASPYRHHTRPSSLSGQAAAPIPSLPVLPEMDRLSSTLGNPVAAFLSSIPSAEQDPGKHALWEELIRLKVKALELEIAHARQKEREAELELATLRSATAVSTSHRRQGSSQSVGVGASSVPALVPSQADPGHAQLSAGSSSTTAAAAGMHDVPSAVTFDDSLFAGLPYLKHAIPPAEDAAALHAMHRASTGAANTSETGMQSTLAPRNAFAQTPSSMQVSSTASSSGMQNTLAPLNAMGQMSQAQTSPMTPFDLEALMRDTQLENMFDWLPMLTPAGADQSMPPTGSFAHSPSFNQSYLLPDPPSTAATDAPQNAASATPAVASTMGVSRRRGSSPGSVTSDRPAKKTRKQVKTVVAEHSPKCLDCAKPIGRVIIRTPKTDDPPQPTSADAALFDCRCLECQPVEVRPIVQDTLNANVPIIDTIETRKRLRAAMEQEDAEKPDSATRAFCDVCQRVACAGVIVGGADKDHLKQSTELICAACDAKYQRCTDCGGGGGSRIGIGKWRLKQVFLAGRKTCRLSHNRVGDRPREIGVHVTPTDFTPEQLKEVLAKCKSLFYEKSMARLAVPEMFEIDMPPHMSNPLKDFSDVEAIIQRQWPTREAMIRAEGADPARFKRILGLTWAHTKARRNVRTVDLEEEAAKNADDEDVSRDTVLANIKRTSVVIPAGCELISMWGGEWDMQQGSLLISTFIPFEGADGDDSTALSVGEIITKVTSLQRKINAQRAEMEQQGYKVEYLRQCEHLWVVSGGAMPLVRERLADILVKKRSFVHVEEYLTRHPEFAEALRARPLGLHPDLHGPLHNPKAFGPDYKPEPLILARWLGRDHDAEQFQEIKQKEFGGKPAKKRATRDKGKA